MTTTSSGRERGRFASSRKSPSSSTTTTTSSPSRRSRPRSSGASSTAPSSRTTRARSAHTPPRYRSNASRTSRRNERCARRSSSSSGVGTLVVYLIARERQRIVRWLSHPSAPAAPLSESLDGRRRRPLGIGFVGRRRRPLAVVPVRPTADRKLARRQREGLAPEGQEGRQEQGQGRPERRRARSEGGSVFDRFTRG